MANMVSQQTRILKPQSILEYQIKSKSIIVDTCMLI